MGDATNTEIFIFGFTGAASGFVLTLLSSYPILTPIFLWLFGCGIEYLADLQRIYRLLCKVIEEHHNRELALEMQNMKSLIKDYQLLAEAITSLTAIECIEEKLCFIQWFKLRQLIQNESAQKCVQDFNEFIKSNVTETIKVRN